MGASALLLSEALPVWKVGAAALVIGGLAMNLLWPTHFGQSAQSLSGCFMRPACASARSPQPQK